jgi:photosystem II stability/assembly factor-like uncharacterized protein
VIAIAIPFLLTCRDSGPSPEDLAWSREDLTSVVVLSDTEALVASESGSIYRSDDASESFRIVHAEAGVSLHALSMLDENRGWAVGDGRILTTGDGGRSWSPQSLPADREMADLRGVYAVDEERVLAVGLAGTRFLTLDGGRSWQDRSDALRRSAVSVDESERAVAATLVEGAREADLLAVFCESESAHRCLTVGSEAGWAYSTDGGESWLSSSRESTLDSDAIVMGEGAVEFDAAARSLLEQAAAAIVPRSDVRIRIEAVASAAEIERQRRRSDPEALFEILEARGLEATGVLEEAGVVSDRLEVRHAPPWGFADLLDDDPDFLERYWLRVRCDRPGLRITGIDGRIAHSGTFVAGVAAVAAVAGVAGVADVAGVAGVERGGAAHVSETSDVVVVGAQGAIWRSVDGGVHFARAGIASMTDLLGVSDSGDGLAAVGEAGVIRISFDSDSAMDAPVELADGPRSGRLRSIDFARGGRFGVIAGDAGQVFKLDGATGAWRSISAPGP